MALFRILISNARPFLETKRAVRSATARMSGGGRMMPEMTILIFYNMITAIGNCACALMLALRTILYSEIK